jgi:hypothetical protein
VIAPDGTGGPASWPPAAPIGGPAGSPPAGTAPSRRVPLIAEAIGYVGGALAIAAVSYSFSLLAPPLSVTGEIAVAAVIGAALLAAGAAVRPGTEPAFRRLRGVLWLLSAVCAALLTGLVTGRAWHLPALTGGVVTSGVTTGYAAVLWLRSRTALLAIAVFVVAAVFVGFVVARADSHLAAWQFGVALWLLSAGWVAAAYGGYAKPRTASLLSGGAGLLIGAQLMAGPQPGLAVALATVAALLGAGAATRCVPIVGVGAAGVIQFVPQAAVRFLPGTIAALAAVFCVGMILLGVALWLTGRWRVRAKS